MVEASKSPTVTSKQMEDGKARAPGPDRAEPVTPGAPALASKGKGLLLVR